MKMSKDSFVYVLHNVNCHYYFAPPILVELASHDFNKLTGINFSNHEQEDPKTISQFCLKDNFSQHTHKKFCTLSFFSRILLFMSQA